MNVTADANWWAFAIDPNTRANKIQSGPNGLHEINPPLSDGRHLIDYHTYIGLDKLLGCQEPSSMIPDERCWIAIHQLFELTFKMMAFDFTVVAETFRQILEMPDDRFHMLCTTSEPYDAFWRPALTASSRIKYSSKTILTAFIGYLLNSEGKDETFSSLEFYNFREYLPPASGFQSAQFRLIQQALGKNNLLSVKLYPAADYWQNYQSKDDQTPKSVVDPVILRGGAQAAHPPKDSPLTMATKLDEYAHQVLDRLSRFSSIEPEISQIPLIEQAQVEQAIDSFRRILFGHRSQQERANVKPADADQIDKAAEHVFRSSLESAVGAENDRRRTLGTARSGAFYLHYIAPGCHLAQVFNRIISADSALHAKHEDSFISLHYRLAKERIQDLMDYAKQIGEAPPPSGTGGGGIPYLGHVRKNLIPLFPALIAYIDLEDSPTFSWID